VHHAGIILIIVVDILPILSFLLFVFSVVVARFATWTLVLLAYVVERERELDR
jgi:hypothetical protein